MSRSKDKRPSKLALRAPGFTVYPDWLKGEANRLDTAPVTAALGYGLTHFGSAAAAAVRPYLAADQVNGPVGIR